MERLINFVYEYRAFFTFLLLEILCAWLIIENNQYQSTRYFNSTNKAVASILNFSHDVREYFSLRDINHELAEENALLRTVLEQRNQRIFAGEIPLVNDTALLNRFEFVSAEVVANSVNQYKNYITINKGSRNGIKPGMAVIGIDGVVGKVKSVSSHYAVLISLLNIDEQVSSEIKSTNYFGTVQWEGTNTRFIDLKYIPRHANPSVGDTVATSGYNVIFPKGILIGIIREVNLKEGSPFWDIQVELSQDFSRLEFVEVVKSNLKQEKDSLEAVTTGIPK